MTTIKIYKILIQRAAQMSCLTKWAILNFFYFSKSGQNPAPFLFIFILFKHKFYRKNQGLGNVEQRRAGINFNIF